MGRHKKNSLSREDQAAVDFAQRVLSNTIRACREERGWSQGELARRMGGSCIQVCHLESGKRSPGLFTIVKVLRALGIKEITIPIVGGEKSAATPMQRLAVSLYTIGALAKEAADSLKDLPAEDSKDGA